MRPNLLLATALLFATLSLHAQDTQPVSPKGGVNALALEYYRIDFSKAQRERLTDVEIEFIYSVDTAGNPSLEKINGPSEPDILDSLRSRTEYLPRFNPAIQNGVPVASIYLLKLVFPSYKLTQFQNGLAQTQLYREAKIEDFEYIHKTGQRLDLLWGGMVNHFVGNPARHLGLGGGMKIDITYTIKNRFLFGMGMNFYGNHLKKAYPLTTTRPQFKAPPTLFIGGVIGKWFGKFNVQLEVTYAVQNITEKQGDNDPEWVQLRGWSPGIILNYPLKFGRDKTYYYYGVPSIFNNYLNLHVGLRPVFLSIDEATGGMLELGVGYRFAVHRVGEYKFKAGFLQR
ncbi:MAG: hypothetical protein KDD14_04975 [Saprospiraceae bacterium]|nr:hypothetical protein [Saprospiraceae bacterium]